MARRLTKRISTGCIGVTPDPRARIGKTDLRPLDVDAIQARSSLPPAPKAQPGDLDYAPFCPPLLIGGVHQIPSECTGESLNDFQLLVVTEKGVKLVPSRRPVGAEKCVIDWCSFTVSEHILRIIRPESTAFSDEEICIAWAEYCISALLRLKCEISMTRGGMMGYDKTAKLGEYGLACSSDTMGLYVSFTGHAFDCADSEFPQRLHDFIQASNTANITRIDIAFDDFEGRVFPVRNIPKMWEQGRFTASKSPCAPVLEFRGDWCRDDPGQRGLTANVGKRESGKVIRFYEKGRQLGDKSSPWVRAELELRSSVFSLIPDMLIKPTSYFVMAAPALVDIEYSGELNKVERIMRTSVTSVQKVLDNIKLQYGGYLHVLRNEFFTSDLELLNAVVRVPDVVPSVLKRANNLFDVLGKSAPVEDVASATVEIEK